jgi:hypothetical protein
MMCIMATSQSCYMFLIKVRVKHTAMHLYPLVVCRMPHVLLMLFVLLDQLRNADQKTSKETNIKLSDWKEYLPV